MNIPPEWVDVAPHIAVAAVFILVVWLARKSPAGRSPLGCEHGDPETRPCMECQREEAW